MTRREFLAASAAVALFPAGCARLFRQSGSTVVNDLHSQLNATRVDRVIKPGSRDAIQKIIRDAKRAQKGISIAGGRHAMGGQQFGADTILIDMNGMNRVMGFDPEKGEIEVEAGIHWPELVDFLLWEQTGRQDQWGIIQKQTGADRLSIGGAVGANIHGRGLRFKPFVGDVESFTLADADGDILKCDRRQNTERFRLVFGGYGLFGVVTSVTLRLAPRQVLERVVEVIDLQDLMPSFEKRIAEGFLYGDFQYSTDPHSDDFLHKGVFSCYRPVKDGRTVPEKQKELSAEDWRELIYLGHVDRKRAFERYSKYYLSSSGQTYWSDIHQMSVYIDHYHEWLDQKVGAQERATEMITEIYVPRTELLPFLDDVASDFRKNRVDLIYGTIRLIEKDDESFLAWAKERYACIIFNLHVVHSREGLSRATRDFRLLIDRAIGYGGSYFPTYHRWATREQVERCYPQLPAFLQLKRKYDPADRFQSEWYRHYKEMFRDKL